MFYSVYGPFELVRKANGLTDTSKEAKKNLCEKLEEVDPGLPNACGCYIFVIKAAQGFKPWYVGITKRQSFIRECFTPTKVKIYNEVLHDGNGKPMLFLLPKITKGNKFAKSSKKDGHKEMDFVESYFISQALDKNREIFNVHKTAILKNIIVSGFINPSKGPQGQSVNSLRRALK